MTKAILITRPDHDLITTYFLHWSNPVIKAATSKGFKVLDLRGKKANNKMFSSYIVKHEPILVFLMDMATRILSPDMTMNRFLKQTTTKNCL